MITYVRNSGVFSRNSTGENVVVCVLMSSENVNDSSLEITGEDVNGLENNVIIGAGTSLLAPNKNLIAYQDGVLSERASS